MTPPPSSMRDTGSESNVRPSQYGCEARSSRSASSSELPRLRRIWIAPTATTASEATTMSSSHRRTEGTTTFSAVRVLVTGGAGFIGSHFAKRLLRAGEDVVVLDKLTYSGNRANPEGADAGVFRGGTR